MPLDYAQALASVEKIQKKSKEFKLPLGQKPKINATTDALISLLSPIHKTDPSIDEELIESFIATFESANIEYEDKNNTLPLESFFSGLAEDYDTLKDKMTAAIEACQSCPPSPTSASSTSCKTRSSSDTLKASSSSQSDNNEDESERHIQQLISALKSEKYKSAISSFFKTMEEKKFDEGTVIPFLNDTKVIAALNTNSKIVALYNSYRKQYGAANSYNLLFLISEDKLLVLLAQTQEGIDAIASIMNKAIVNGFIDSAITISKKINADIFFELMKKLTQSNESHERPVSYLRNLFNISSDKRLTTLITKENIIYIRHFFNEILSTQKYSSNPAMTKMLSAYLITTTNHERCISTIKALLILSNRNQPKKAKEISNLSEAVAADHAKNTLFPCVTSSRLAFILSQSVNKSKRKRTAKHKDSEKKPGTPSEGSKSKFSH